MKYNLLSLILGISLFLAACPVQAQKLTIESFDVAAGDLSARTKEGRVDDANGDPCALVKVQLARAGAAFYGDIVGTPKYRQSEYWVSLIKGTKQMQINVEGFLPLMVQFPEPLQSLTTYKLVLTMPQTLPGQSVDDGLTYLSLSVTPASAQVEIDGVLQALEADGTLMARFQRGNHTYKVFYSGYSPESGTFTLGTEKRSLNITLQSLMAQLTVKCATAGASIYVNEKLRSSNSSWTGSLGSGSYIVEVRKDGYYPQQQSVVLKQKEVKSIDIPALIARSGSLDVAYKPMDSEVWIDGSKLGTSPDLFQNVVVGNHRVEIRKDGYNTFAQDITITEGQTYSLKGTLSKPVATAASAPSKEAQALYDKAYEYEKSKDYAKALEYYRQSADLGNAKAVCQIGCYYDRGYGVSQDYYEAARWYRKAAEQGNSIAQFILGYFYEIGRGVTRDYTEAVKWSRKSAEQGYASGQLELGYLYDKGYGVSQDYYEAARWYRKAAEQGNMVAQSNLGWCYENGKGVIQDYNEAVKWRRKSAEQGYASGQLGLGYLYDRGYGVSQDYYEAARWYRKAAEQGNMVAQSNLGWCYENGKGVTQDTTEAVKWYRKAAEQGQQRGKDALTRLGY